MTMGRFPLARSNRTLPGLVSTNGRSPVVRCEARAYIPTDAPFDDHVQHHFTL